MRYTFVTIRNHRSLHTWCHIMFDFIWVLIGLQILCWSIVALYNDYSIHNNKHKYFKVLLNIINNKLHNKHLNIKHVMALEPHLSFQNRTLIVIIKIFVSIQNIVPKASVTLKFNVFVLRWTERVNMILTVQTLNYRYNFFPFKNPYKCLIY